MINEQAKYALLLQGTQSDMPLDAFKAYLGYNCLTMKEATETHLSDASLFYQGHFESRTDFAQHMAFGQVWYDVMPLDLRHCFDLNKYADSLESEGYWEGNGYWFKKVPFWWY